MNQAVSKKEAKIEKLMSILLTTLDEKLFFSSLDKFLKNEIACDHSKIYIVRDDNSAVLISNDGKKAKKSAKLDRGHGPAGHVIKTRRPYFSNSAQRDPLFASQKEEGIQCELIMPISHEGIVIATAHFQVKDSEIEYSMEDIKKLQEVLEQIKQPLSNMKMYLSAKHLNESLMKKIELKEKELANKGEGHAVSDSYLIEEKEIVGKSESMKEVLRVADKLSQIDVCFFVEGEKGVGKEMVARRIHCRSERKKRPFMSVDCSSLDELSLEKELFGHEIVDFNGIHVKNGVFEIANGGTVFLSNIEKLTIHLQSKICTMINEKAAYRVGAQKPFKSDVKIVAASNLELSEKVKSGDFREDLYFILNTMSIRVPSLRERVEDIETLATHFLNASRAQDEQKSLSPGAISALKTYNWPGNVRELQNIIERAFILSDGMIVEKNHISDHVVEFKAEPCESEDKEENITFGELTLDELEKRHICHTLERLGGNKTKTAKTLGITVKTLYNKLHSYGMIQAKEV
ncbi:MAG: sigma-54-dependent Fis family transcriptional regulator [Oligoflexia bacterium]|nr:sigma-54-dependent Fis family transcriptional regulator [Oligoflexia bacterium]